MLRRGRRRDEAERGALQRPSLALSDRYAILMNEAPVHPGDAPVVSAPVASPTVTASPPPVDSAGQAAHHSTIPPPLLRHGCVFYTCGQCWTDSQSLHYEEGPP